jgi:hypothetical protein
MRKFILQESPNYFFLTSADKCIKRFHVMHIKKLDDTHPSKYTLADIILADQTSFTAAEFDKEMTRLKEMH